ncbi:MAG: hypothetical protein JWM19_7019 [Actinomycetia bacterium]|nr:hypothetical protein [Actinomycetes bacterium]
MPECQNEGRRTAPPLVDCLSQQLVLLGQCTYSKVHYSPVILCERPGLTSRTVTAAQGVEPSSSHRAAMGSAVSRSPKESWCSPA